MVKWLASSEVDSWNISSVVKWLASNEVDRGTYHRW